jgi:hypothetical protein
LIVHLSQNTAFQNCEHDHIKVKSVVKERIKRGEGTFTISFDNIDHISFRLNAERLTGLVKLRDGGTSELNLNKTQKAFGLTKYGTFQIKLSDLKKLVIRTAAPRRDQITKSQGPEQLDQAAPARNGFKIIPLQTAFLRKPERMHRVQAFTRLTSPDLPSTHRIF